MAYGQFTFAAGCEKCGETVHKIEGLNRLQRGSRQFTELDESQLPDPCKAAIAAGVCALANQLKLVNGEGGK